MTVPPDWVKKPVPGTPASLIPGGVQLLGSDQEVWKPPGPPFQVRMTAKRGAGRESRTEMVSRAMEGRCAGCVGMAVLAEKRADRAVTGELWRWIGGDQREKC